MADKKEVSKPFLKNSIEKDNFIISKKYLVIFGVFIFILVFVFFVWYFFIHDSQKISFCGDGTSYGQCSMTKPYFCLEGILVEKAPVCGCAEVLSKREDSCVSQYQTKPKNISLQYILRGEKNQIDYVVYGGMVDYISTLPIGIYYKEGDEPSKTDFKLKLLEEKEQRELLLPLVVEIQKIAEDKDDSVRIAVSIVQNIPFGNSNKTINFGRSQVNYSRYPYEVLYDMQGVCGEKSVLLAFLLREMDYGVVSFYHSLENHESIGIKCPVEYSLNNTGCCFIETTGPSIITDNGIKYVGGLEISSEPELILISEGDSLDGGLYEYRDAKAWKKIRKIIDKNGGLNIFRSFKQKKLIEKYGLSKEYNI